MLYVICGLGLVGFALIGFMFVVIRAVFKINPDEVTEDIEDYP